MEPAPRTTVHAGWQNLADRDTARNLVASGSPPRHGPRSPGVINSPAAWSLYGQTVALTLSKDGNPGVSAWAAPTSAG
jgi:hypothetical protein